MHYIIGLGNPGAQYTNTRHNVGRIILEQIREQEGMPDWTKDKPANAFKTAGAIAGESVELLEPETYMNKSGETVRFLAQKCGAAPETIVVVYDDVDLPLGELKITKGRGSGGHNGIESIVQALGSKNFIRIRIGVSPTSFWTGKIKRPTGAAMNTYVLGKFSRGELGKVEEVGERAYGALQVILTDGIEKAMNQYN